MALVLTCEGLEGCMLSLTVFVIVVDVYKTAIQPSLRKLKLFLMILYKLKKEEFFVRCCIVKILQIFNFSTQGTFCAKKWGGMITLIIPP